MLSFSMVAALKPLSIKACLVNLCLPFLSPFVLEVGIWNLLSVITFQHCKFCMVRPCLFPKSTSSFLPYFAATAFIAAGRPMFELTSAQLQLESAATHVIRDQRSMDIRITASGEGGLHVDNVF